MLVAAKEKQNTICNSQIILSAVSGSFALFKIRIGLEGMLVFLCLHKIKAIGLSYNGNYFPAMASFVAIQKITRVRQLLCNLI